MPWGGIRNERDCHCSSNVGPTWPSCVRKGRAGVVDVDLGGGGEGGRPKFALLLAAGRGRVAPAVAAIVIHESTRATPSASAAQSNRATRYRAPASAYPAFQALAGARWWIVAVVGWWAAYQPAGTLAWLAPQPAALLQSHPRSLAPPALMIRCSWLPDPAQWIGGVAVRCWASLLWASAGLLVPSRKRKRIVGVPEHRQLAASSASATMYERNESKLTLTVTLSPQQLLIT